mmetsp:Transcript_20963/g.29423  ORF Transcript_20963/g.29423 Transcript_20963/m.29423 type:complete len:90 (+) Transcript_20963:317-586(+)
MLSASWAGCKVMMEPTMLPTGTTINSNGAGDAFTSGLLVATLLCNGDQSMTLQSAAKFACAVAANHIDTSTRDSPYVDMEKLLKDCDAL